MAKQSLTDILNGGGGWFDGNWGDIPPAPDFGSPIPAGKYIAHLRELDPFKAKTGTPGINLVFEIIEGDHKGRRCWYPVWLTEAAKKQAVRDLGKLGIKSREQAELPVPRWIRCAITVAVRTNDQQEEYNRVKTFDVLGIDKPEADPFAPQDKPEGGPTV